MNRLHSPMSPGFIMCFVMRVWVCGLISFHRSMSENGIAKRLGISYQTIAYLYEVGFFFFWKMVFCTTEQNCHRVLWLHLFYIFIHYTMCVYITFTYCLDLIYFIALLVWFYLVYPIRMVFYYIWVLFLAPALAPVFGELKEVCLMHFN